MALCQITLKNHHHITLVARISLTLSRHSSVSFIALGRSSGQHPVSSHSCWMYVRAGRPAFSRPCVGVHKSTSLMSSSLLLQQCPACLVRLTWIVFVIGGRWPYSWCLAGCCRQDLFKIVSLSQSTWCIQQFSSLFFVQTFRIVEDSWKFNMLLLYILWDDWPFFYDFRFKWTATAGIRNTLLKPDCHSWWISKNAIWTWRHFRRPICNKIVF